MAWARLPRPHPCAGGLLAFSGSSKSSLGHGPADTESVAVDGKSARGSRTDTAPAAHLLSAVTAAGRTVSQLRVPDRTNEITGFTALLAPFDPAGAVVTADALHTQREDAKWLVEEKNAHYLMVVKGNQPKLHAAVRALPWKEVTARRYDRQAGHGRRETRSVGTLTVTGLPSRRPDGEDAAAPHRPEDRQGHLTDHPRHHRHDIVTGITAAHQSYHQSAVGHRGRPLRQGNDVRRGRLQDPGRSTWPPFGTSRSTLSGTPVPQCRRRTPRGLLYPVHPPTRPPRTSLICNAT
ncbi:ISAs1 family transposase [Streptomyces sp. NPDC059918]|uniref:ISAs1 family transposase n=1 Tax=unclassified Streptomyces TaxID=2593676 RepID=UPI00365D1F93